MTNLVDPNGMSSFKNSVTFSLKVLCCFSFLKISSSDSASSKSFKGMLKAFVVMVLAIDFNRAIGFCCLKKSLSQSAVLIMEYNIDNKGSSSLSFSQAS